MGKTYGYARVSARDQNLDRQLDAFVEFGIEDDLVFADKASGRDFDRPEYKRLIAALRAGDVLVVKSIDRLGRNYDEILEQWRILTKERGIAVVILDMPLLDTRMYRDSLTSVLISDIVLQLLLKMFLVIFAHNAGRFSIRRQSWKRSMKCLMG